MSALRPAFFILYLESCISRLNVIPCHDLTLSVSDCPQKNVPPHNTPDRFAAVSPDKILRLYCVGGLFLFREAVP